GDARFAPGPFGRQAGRRDGRDGGGEAEGAVVRAPHLLRLRKQGEALDRAPRRGARSRRARLRDRRPDAGRDRDPEQPAPHRPEEGLSRLRAGPDGDGRRHLVRAPEHAGRHGLRQRQQQAGPPFRGRGAVDPEGDGGGPAEGEGHLRAWRHGPHHRRAVRRLPGRDRRDQPGAGQDQGPGVVFRAGDSGRTRLSAGGTGNV
ncbi:MAG: Transcription antitermination protein NusG, partial [uncultured Thermomicrobiales bacterium]